MVASSISSFISRMMGKLNPSASLSQKVEMIPCRSDTEMVISCALSIGAAWIGDVAISLVTFLGAALLAFFFAAFFFGFVLLFVAAVFDSIGAVGAVVSAGAGVGAGGGWRFGLCAPAITDA